MEIKFIYDENKQKFIEANNVERIASLIISKYVFTLSPGGEIYVATTVTDKKLYNWLERIGSTILNKYRTNHKFDKIIAEAMKKNQILQFGWTIDNGLKGKYVSLKDGRHSNDDTVRIILNNTPIYVI